MKKNMVRIYFLFLYLLFFLLVCPNSVLSFWGSNKKSSSACNKPVSFAYISDLYFYPTPLNASGMSLLEKKDGILINETQTITHELVNYINKNYTLDFVAFGGNNISPFNRDCLGSCYLLFVDVVKELKCKIVLLFGEADIQNNSTLELLRASELLGYKTNYTWWAKELNGYLFIALDSSAFKYSTNLFNEQLKWLENLLESHKENKIIVFVNNSLINHDLSLKDDKHSSELQKIINRYSNIKLIVSGNELITRIFKNSTNQVFLISPSPSAYPCSFPVVELYSDRIVIKIVKLPLKGFIKKAEQSLIYSERAVNRFHSNPKDILNHVVDPSKKTDFVFYY